MRLALALAVLLGACADAPPSGPPTLSVRAEFIQPMYDSEAVLVRHEALPGRMPAMRMAMLVADPTLLDGFSPGDPVTLTLDSLSLAVVAAEPLPSGTVLDLPDDLDQPVEFSPEAVRPER